jgi:hypothetical protein
MAKYLGETIVNIEDTPYVDYSQADWASEYILNYGQIDGAHHKQWVLDQALRILKGTPIILKLAKWDDGNEEYRYNTGDPSPEYAKTVQEYLGEYDEENDEYEYGYDEGIAP